ncbi:hypothetical protein ACLBOM_08370 [Escherichia coli]
MQFIQGFDTKAGKIQLLLMLLLMVLLLIRIHVIAPNCSVSGDALIEHGSHTPDSIKNDVAKSSPVTISCNTDVKAKVRLRRAANIRAFSQLDSSVDMAHARLL